jgi:hypothetical protein
MSFGEDDKPEHSSLKSWVVASLVYIAIIGLIGFYGLLHVALHVPFVSLLEPYGIVFGLTLLFGPSMYWATKTDAHHPDNRKRSISVAGGYLWSTVLVGIHYAGRLGVLDEEAVVPMYLICTVIILGGCLFGYNLRREPDAPVK